MRGESIEEKKCRSKQLARCSNDMAADGGPLAFVWGGGGGGGILCFTMEWLETASTDF